MNDTPDQLTPATSTPAPTTPGSSAPTAPIAQPVTSSVDSGDYEAQRQQKAAANFPTLVAQLEQAQSEPDSDKREHLVGKWMVDALPLASNPDGAIRAKAFAMMNTASSVVDQTRRARLIAGRPNPAVPDAQAEAMDAPEVIKAQTDKLRAGIGGRGADDAWIDGLHRMQSNAPEDKAWADRERTLMALFPGIADGFERVKYRLDQRKAYYATNPEGIRNAGLADAVRRRIDALPTDQRLDEMRRILGTGAIDQGVFDALIDVSNADHWRWERLLDSALSTPTQNAVKSFNTALDGTAEVAGSLAALQLKRVADLTFTGAPVKWDPETHSLVRLGVPTPPQVSTTAPSAGSSTVNTQ